MTFMTHTFATYPKTNNFGHPDHQAGPHNPFIAQVQPRPFFHPIIDVYTGRIIGYETLARGMPPYEMPQDIFGEAHRRGLEAEVEEACLQETLRA
ncbi:MAG: hypothetical protein N2Z74_10270, partial [Syntrophales bacterium]|nr:hypothetical protein [Syntrophales bacterium]